MKYETPQFDVVELDEVDILKTSGEEIEKEENETPGWKPFNLDKTYDN